MQLALSDKKGKRSGAAKTTRLADIERLLSGPKSTSKQSPSNGVNEEEEEDDEL